MPFWLLQKLNPRSWIAPQEPEEIAEESQKEKEEAAEASDDETPKERRPWMMLTLLQLVFFNALLGLR